MEVTTLYKYGFEYKGVVYGWKNKKLFRLPYTKDKRSYSLKEIPFYCYKTTLVANIQRTKLTLNRIKNLTKQIDIEINSYICDDCPF
jgi:hypothetical protein